MISVRAGSQEFQDAIYLGYSYIISLMESQMIGRLSNNFFKNISDHPSLNQVISVLCHSISSLFESCPFPPTGIFFCVFFFMVGEHSIADCIKVFRFVSEMVKSSPHSLLNNIDARKRYPCHLNYISSKLLTF